MGKVSRKKRNSSDDALKKGSERVESSTIAVKTDFAHNPIVHVLLIIILGLIAYSNTFHVPFMFDDPPNLLNNPIVTSFKYFVAPSTAKTFPAHAALKSRFIGYLTFALNYKMHGFNVTGYHIVNLTIHIINALLVYLIVVLTFRTFAIRRSADYNQRVANLIALFSALLFVSHPVQTQAVTYIIQRFTSLAAMFYLLSIASYIRSRLSTKSSIRYAFYLISLIAAVFAMKTKEFAFTLPVMITMYELMFFEGKLTKRIPYLIPFVLTMAIIPYTLLSLDKPIGSLISDVSEATKVQTAMSRLDYLFTQFRVIVTYIRLLFVPIRQNLDYDYPIYHSFFDIPVFLSFLVLALIVSLGIYLFYRYRSGVPYTRVISFGVFLFFIALSVESSIIPIVDVIFEHRVYLPSVGAFIAVTTSLFIVKDKLVHKKKKIEKAIIPGLALIVIVFAGATHMRNIVWQDEVNLWSDVVEKSPFKVRGHNNLGNAYIKKGLIDKAIEQYQTALRLKPDFTEAYYNLGNAYRSKGQLDKAIEQYQTALRLKPDFAETHFNLGLIYLNYGSKSIAKKEFELGLESKPDDHRARQILNSLSKSKR